MSPEGTESGDALLDGENGVAGAGPIARRTLHDEVATRLRDRIVEGALAPGARVNESQLGQELGVSRTPMREALKTLAGEGLVELSPGRGAVVRRLGAADVFSMLELLAELEAMAGRLACARASPDGVAGVAALHAAMLARFAAGDRLSYFKLNQRIHSSIVALAGNPALAETHGALQARLKRIRYIGNHAPEKWRDAVAEHEEMVAALTARDGEALSAVLRRHLQRTWERVRDVL